VIQKFGEKEADFDFFNKLLKGPGVLRWLSLTLLLLLAANAKELKAGAAYQR